MFLEAWLALVLVTDLLPAPLTLLCCEGLEVFTHPMGREELV